MSTKLRTVVAAVATLTGVLIPVAAAQASLPRPADLRVVGGDEWHAATWFRLAWGEPPTRAPALVATNYRVHDPQGAVIREGQANDVADGLTFTVPEIPGSYDAEVWFEDAVGAQGPAATASLRFDNVRPAAVALAPAPRWIGRTGLPLRVRIGHPPGPLPLSGIRGYAAAIDRVPIAFPCKAIDLCTDAETDLRGGIGEDELTIATLPEGVSYLHAVAVSGSGMKSATSANALLRVDLTDPVTRLEGAPPDWVNHAVSLQATATDAASGMAVANAGPPAFTAIRVDRGAPAVTSGASTATRVIAEGIHLIEYYARDAAGNVDDGGHVNGIPNRPPRTALVRIDRTPATLAFANSEDADDPDLLRAWVDDELSGADRSRGWIGFRRAHSNDSFQRLPRVQSLSGELRVRWDSDSYPLGEYEFQATAYDEAGNASVTSKRRNGATMILANPLKAPTRLSAKFHGKQSERTVPFGRGVLLSGRLTTGIKTPLGGMVVRIVERFAASRGPAVRVSTVKTGSDGAYSIHLAPGPSREITASFPGNPTLARSTSGSLRLAVRSAMRLRASSGVAKVGGAPLVLSGRVFPPEAIPAEGKSVQLQFRLPGQPWSEFRTVQTDRRGRFRYAYRFSDDDSRGARFQFRAYAPAQENWPYEPGGSRPVLVRGT